MSDSRWIKTLVAAAVLLLIGAVVLHFANRAPRNQPTSQVAVASSESARTESPRSTYQAPRVDAAQAAETDADGEESPSHLPREKVEEYLQQRNRSAASLLAAFHALD